MHLTPRYIRSTFFSIFTLLLFVMVIHTGSALPNPQITPRDLPPNELPADDLNTLFLSGETVLYWPGSTNNPEFIQGVFYVRNSSKVWEKQAEIKPVSGEEYTGLPKALDGDTAVFTIYGRDDHSPEPEPEIDGRLTIYRRSGTTWTKQQTLTFNPNFGTDAAIDGNTILVSDPGQYDSYTRTIHFVEYDGTTWHVTESFDVDSGPGGALVALSGDLALAGVGEGETGYYRTYQRIGGAWTEVATLNSGYSEWFDLSGNTAVVNNRVYVFDGTNWSHQATLNPDETFIGPEIGALDGDTLLLSTPHKTFVFKRSGTTWTQVKRLSWNAGNIGYRPDEQYYEINVQLSGDLALVQRFTFDIGALIDPPQTPEPTSEQTPEVTSEITLTPPPTDEPTDEPTSEPTAEPTSGPPATATPQQDTALNANPGFETGSLEPWKVKDSSGDKLKCSADKPKSHAGLCAFKFNNAKGSSGKLVQKIDFSTRANPVIGTASDALQLTLYARTKNGAEGKAKVVVKYADGSKQKFSLALADAPSAYTAFSKSEVLTQTAITKVKLVIKGTNGQGKLFVDDVNLLKVGLTAGLDTLPLP